MTRRALAASGATALAVAALVVMPAPGAVAAEEPNQRCEVGKTQYIKDARAASAIVQTGFPDAWRTATGDGVTIAIVDSGVDTGNKHLGPAVKDQGRSYVDGPATQDGSGHGTAVAGLAGARPVDGSVIYGAAPASTLLPVRVLYDLEAGPGVTSRTAEGIRYAADQGADVINVSISTGPSDRDLPKLKSAVAFAVRKGAIVVAAAGDRPQGTPYTQVQYPAGFPGVIGVAAANTSGDVDDFSIHGEHVDVVAPGMAVGTTFRAYGDCLLGLQNPLTSYAAPYVSGLAALLKERFPEDSAQEITNRILSTADRPREDERDDRRGWGGIQPAAAVLSTSNAKPGSDEAAEVADTQQLTPELTSADPRAAAEDQLAWWSLSLLGLAAVGLVVMPLARRRSAAAGAPVGEEVASPPVPSTRPRPEPTSVAPREAPRAEVVEEAPRASRRAEKQPRSERGKRPKGGARRA